MTSELTIGSHRFRSRLIVGTGKYPSPEIMRRAIVASGAEMITVAIGRVDLSRRGAATVLDELAPLGLTILPNTAGATTAKDAIRIAHLAREAGLGELVKLEVIGDPKTLFPDTEALLAATLRWPLSVWAIPLWVARDLMLPWLWLAAISGGGFAWRGNEMHVRRRRAGDLQLAEE